LQFHGNPNVGKSTIFNALTGMNQHTGNWPGKTISNTTGNYMYKDTDFLLVDIPGTYSLMSNSQEEEIARDYICFGNPNVTVVVLDATCLERNLNLVFQIFEITENVIVCVNLLDEAKKKGLKIDLQLLEQYLGVPVVGTIANNKKTLTLLTQKILEVCNGDIIPNPKKVKYHHIIEECIELIVSDLQTLDSIKNKKNINNYYLYRWIALKIIDGEPNIIKSIENNLNIPISNNKDINIKLEKIYSLLKDFSISKTNFKDKIVSNIILKCEGIYTSIVSLESKNIKEKYLFLNSSDLKIDKILTSKKFGIPIMILLLGIVFWITIVGANYPSSLLFNLFLWFQNKLLYTAEILHIPKWISDMLILGMYQTITWVVSVMLPPMAIFFPLFTILEDLGYLPRIAFNLDNFFKKACSSGKQALTMCMGFGCNVAGVIGCRIIDSPRERIIAIITNAFVPCNGRFPFLIIISTIFIAGSINGFLGSILSTLSVLLIILLGIFMTLFISKLLSKTILKGLPSSFILELPPYRKPQISKIIVRSIFDRTLFVLARSIAVAAPTGIVIWIMANLNINDISILSYISNFLDPFANILGLDGYILTAFILGIPANEIVLPIILMGYLKNSYLVNFEEISTISDVLVQNGWNILTAINVMIFTLLHFPCSTTLLSIKKETGSIKWTILSFLLPTIFGIILCIFTTLVYNFIF